MALANSMACPGGVGQVHSKTRGFIEFPVQDHYRSLASFCNHNSRDAKPVLDRPDAVAFGPVFREPAGEQLQLAEIELEEFGPAQQVFQGVAVVMRGAEIDIQDAESGEFLQ